MNIAASNECMNVTASHTCKNVPYMWGTRGWPRGGQGKEAGRVRPQGPQTTRLKSVIDKLLHVERGTQITVANKKRLDSLN